MSKTRDRAVEVRKKLSLLAAEVDGYGCKDMTHREVTREKWHRVEDRLRLAVDAVQQAFFDE